MSLLLFLAQAVSCTPGVYLVADGAVQPLNETRADRRKVTGLAGAVLLGPFGGGRMKVKSVVPGASAATRVKPGRPTFRFCFAAPAPAAVTGSDYVGVDAPASTPGEFHLVRFDAGKDQRELALSVPRSTSVSAA